MEQIKAETHEWDCGCIAEFDENGKGKMIKKCETCGTENTENNKKSIFLYAMEPAK